MEQLLRESLAFYHDLPEADRRLLLSAVFVSQHPKGTVFMHGGAECAGVEILQTGRARVFALSPNGAEITLFRLMPGDVCLLSAACMLRNLTVETSMELESDTRMIVIPTGVYQSLQERVPAVKSFTLELMAEKFSDVMWVLNQFVFTGAARRLADALLAHAALVGGNTLPLTHELLARDLGTAREVVTRLLKQFQLDGLVALSRGKIELLDAKKLSKL